ncbi:MAG: Bax inhibitor-1/YccA family protein [Bacteriovoracaceae bacterium]
MNSNQELYPQHLAQVAISRFMSKVYTWMSLGILLTGFVAAAISNDEQLVMQILGNKILFYGLMIAEFGMVIWLSAGINKMSSTFATVLFFAYAALNGVTLSVFSLIYTQSSIQSAFFTTVFGFTGLSAFGYFTKKDLGPVGSFCTMGLFGMIGFSLLSFFFPSMMGGMASQIYGIVGLIVFAGLTAYDTQKIKGLAPRNADASAFQKGAIMGALQLYLDFINLFLFLLRFSGKRK